MAPLRREDYTIGWICALPIELTAAICVLDERHDQLPNPPNDDNQYVLGSIVGANGRHNVAIACLPSFVTGTTSACSVAHLMQSTFRNVKYYLMVGIGGGVPSQEADIRLGDVVIGVPGNRYNGVLQYDFGKSKPEDEGSFSITGSLNKPPRVLLKGISTLRASLDAGNTFQQQITALLGSSSGIEQSFSSPGAGNDQLYHHGYDHAGGDDCEVCDSAHLVTRPSRQDVSSHVHYGLIGSANHVMRDGTQRENLREEFGLLCFEMEAAGLVDDFPCLVIRGICDYSDSHKNKRWQPYAALTAAAYGKELLGKVLVSQWLLSAQEIQQVAYQRRDILHWISPLPYVQYHSQVHDARDLLPRSGEWLLEHEEYLKWREAGTSSSLLWLRGEAGSGKTVLTSHVIERHITDHRTGEGPMTAYFYCSRSSGEGSRSSPASILASIARQLACDEDDSRTPVQSPAVELFQKKSYGVQAGGLTRSEYRVLIIEVSRLVPELVVILDALDELERLSAVDLLEDLSILMNSCDNIRLLVSSRNYEELRQRLEQHPNINTMTERNRKDVERFVQWKTDNYMHNRLLLDDWPNKEELKAIIIEKTIAGAGAMFRWADMHIEVLATLSTESDLRAQLGRNPPLLEDLYDQLYEDIMKMAGGPTGRGIIRNTFKWLICATTSFRSSDLTLAVSMTLPISFSEIRPEQILRLCRNFVLHDNELDVLRFTHLSVREYLEKHRLSSVPACHSLAAEACLMNLIAIPDNNDAKEFLLRDCGVDISGKLLPLIRSETSHFHHYACEHWMYHYRLAEQARKIAGKLKRLTEHFLLAESSGPTPFDLWLPWHLNWFPHSWGVDENWRGSSENMAHLHGRNRSSTSFILACSFGLYEVLISVLENNRPDESLMDAGLSVLLFGLFRCGDDDAESQKLAQTYHQALEALKAANPQLQLTDELLEDMILSICRQRRGASHATSLFHYILTKWPDKKVRFSTIALAVWRGVDDAVLNLITDRAADVMPIQKELEELSKDSGRDSRNPQTIRLLVARLNGDLKEETLMSDYFSELDSIIQEYDKYAITEKVLLGVLDRSRSESAEISKILEVLARASDESITPKVFTCAMSFCNMDIAMFMIERTSRTFKSAITKDLLLTAADGGDINFMSQVLNNGGESLVDTEVLHTAVTSIREEMGLRLSTKRKDMQVTHSTMCTAVCTPDLLELLLCHGGRATQALLEEAVGFCEMRMFTVMLKHGGRITYDVALRALGNPSDDIIRYILDQDRQQGTHHIGDIWQFLEGAFALWNASPEVMRYLIDQDPRDEIPSPVIISMLSSKDMYGCRRRYNMRVLLNSGKTLLTAEEWLPLAMELFNKGDLAIQLVEAFPSIVITERLLVAMLKHQTCGFLLLSHLYPRTKEIAITPDIVRAAVGNKYHGRQIIAKLVDCSDRFVVTEEIAITAASTGSVSTMVFLLDHDQRLQITDRLLLAAACNTDMGMEMIDMLCARHPRRDTEFMGSLLKAALSQPNIQPRGLQGLLDHSGITSISKDLLSTFSRACKQAFPDNHLRQSTQQNLRQSLVFDRLLVYGPGVHDLVLAVATAKKRSCWNLINIIFDYVRYSRGTTQYMMLAVSTNSEYHIKKRMQKRFVMEVTEQTVEAAATSGNQKALLWLEEQRLWTQNMDHFKMVAKMRRAVDCGDTDLTWECLLANIPPNLPDFAGRTPLFSAAGRGYDDIAMILLHKGADPSHKDCSGQTPLFYAARKGHWKVVEMLPHGKEESTEQDVYGESPLSIARKRGRSGVLALLLNDIEDRFLSSTKDEGSGLEDLDDSDELNSEDVYPEDEDEQDGPVSNLIVI